MDSSDSRLLACERLDFPTAPEAYFIEFWRSAGEISDSIGFAQEVEIKNGALEFGLFFLYPGACSPPVGTDEAKSD